MNQYPWIAKANTVFLWILSFQAIAAFIIGISVDAFLSTLVLSALILAVPILLIINKPFDSVTRHAVGVATQMFTALHINLSMGLTEVHFEIFTLLAVLSWYRDWKVVASSVVFVAIHHVSFFIVQTQGGSFYIFEQGHLFFYILVLHAFFAVAEGVVLGIMASQNHNEAVESYNLRHGVEAVLKDPETICLSDGCAMDARKDSMLGRLLWSVRDALDSIMHSNSIVTGALGTLNDINHTVQKDTSASASEVAMISSSITQMAASVDDVARRAAEVSEASQQALLKTEDTKSTLTNSNNNVGALKVRLDEMATIVSALDEKTQDIASVMTSIEAVAEQTNLLALNAAIEAARAGEQGRGFAVVADEVRSLAGNTKDSTDRIKLVIDSLVGESSKAVSIIDSCVDLAVTSAESSEGAQSATDELMRLINSVAENITSVAASVEQQVSVAKEININTENLNEIIQNNERSVESANHSVSQLNQAVDSSEKELKVFVV